MSDRVLLALWAAISFSMVLPLVGIMIVRKEEKPYDERQTILLRLTYRDTLFVMIAICAMIAIFYGVRNSYGMEELSTTTVVLSAVAVTGFSLYSAICTIRNVHLGRKVTDPRKWMNLVVICWIACILLGGITIASGMVDFSLPLKFSNELLLVGIMYVGIVQLFAIAIRKHLDKKEGAHG